MISSCLSRRQEEDRSYDKSQTWEGVNNLSNSRSKEFYVYLKG